MDAMDVEVLGTAVAWMQAGHRATLGTVTRTWGSAPRPPGSMMVIRDDGRVVGSLSGGCIEDDLIARVRAGEVDQPLPQVVAYGGDGDEGRRFGLPCGGTVQVVLERLGSRSALVEVLAAVSEGRRVVRVVDLVSGEVTIVDEDGGAAPSFDGQILRTVHGPVLRLLIVGAGQMTRYLASMATLLDYRVTVCDPRVEYLDVWEAMPGVCVSRDMPDDLVLSMHVDANCAVVALSHDRKLDDMVLLEALRSPAFYVGALGSQRNNTARRQRLLDFDLSAEQIARLHGPVGLNLGALTPPEIALSVLAEMTAARRGALPLVARGPARAAAACLSSS